MNESLTLKPQLVENQEEDEDMVQMVEEDNTNMLLVEEEPPADNRGRSSTGVKKNYPGQNFISLKLPQNDIDRFIFQDFKSPRTEENPIQQTYD